MYTPLHVHSDASLDGAGTVQSLVAEAKRLDFKHLALTDHGTLANAVAFWSACQDAEIKPILGMEAYLMWEAKRYHITLLSLNEDGFNNLIALDSDAHTNNYSGGYPLVTMDSLNLYHNNLYALTGCASSAMFHDDEMEAMKYVGQLVDIFNRSHVGLETMFVGTHNTWSRPIEFSTRLGLPIIVTNDTHYPCREQFHAHQTICKARRGFTYDSQHLWLKSEFELESEGIKYVDQATVIHGLQNSFSLGEFVQPWDMKAAPTLPHIPDVEEKLSGALRHALKLDVLVKGERELRLARLRREFRILHDKQFLDYIYILWDIVLWAKAQGIVVGPGRGSGGGSYVLYLLGITSIDPIQYGLLFERFINPSRADYPDVDVDFESDRRHEVTEYASQRWGTIPIATYSCYSHKSAIHDIARVLVIPKDLEDAAADSPMDSDKFRDFINDKPNGLVTYNTMLGQIRHRGKHAAGVIIPNRPVPIERSGEELVAAWAEGMNTKDLSKVGIVKYDILGLTALSQLKVMRKLTGKVAPDRFTDPEVFELFCQGDVAGIFQWSGSDGIRELTRRIAPRSFYDLTTCNALYRPGALDAGTAELYPQFMKKPRLLHPKIDRILENTYGVICYQEQVMAVVAEVFGDDVASGGLVSADNARRLLSKAAVGDKKWEDEVGMLQRDFIRKGTKSGFDLPLLNTLWSEIYTHSGYSYNLSHATAYTSISYKMAWYKVYHRPAFTVAVLQYDKVNAQTYIVDAVQHGLEIAMPDVNHSTLEYNLKGNIIYLPLSDINYLGEKGATWLVQDVEDNGPYTTYKDFNDRVPKRTCNNRARQMMERIGAFDGLDGFAIDAIDKYDEIPLTNEYTSQAEVLGYIVPSQKLIAQMHHLANLPTKKGWTRFAGFIAETKNKKSGHGPYTVYTLSPSGSFWVRGEPNDKLKVGAFVSGSKTTFGNSNDVRIYRIGGS